jgi:hypothetical protein
MSGHPHWDNEYLILSFLDGQLSPSPRERRARRALVEWIDENVGKLWVDDDEIGSHGFSPIDVEIREALLEFFWPGRRIEVGKRKGLHKTAKYEAIISLMLEYQLKYGRGSYDSSVKQAVKRLGVSKGTAVRAWGEYRRAQRESRRSGAYSPFSLMKTGKL